MPTISSLTKSDYDKRLTAGPIANLMLERKINHKEAGVKMAKLYPNVTRAEFGPGGSRPLAWGSQMLGHTDQISQRFRQHFPHDVRFSSAFTERSGI
jgi:hypothetical protein